MSSLLESLIELIDWSVSSVEIHSVMLVFSTQLCELLWTFSLVHLPHPPPFAKSKYRIYRKCVAGKGGCWVVLETIFCMGLLLCFLTRFRIYIIASWLSWLVGSALACCKAGPSSNLGSAQGGFPHWAQVQCGNGVSPWRMEMETWPRVG